MGPHRLLAAVALAMVLAGATACVAPPPPRGGDPCVVGEYTLSTQELARPINGPLGSLTLTGGTGGRRLTLSGDGAARLTADGSDPVEITGTSDAGAVSAVGTVTVDADGFWSTAPDGRLTLTLTRSTGTATVRGTAGAKAFDVTIPLDSSGLGEAYAPSGTVQYSCGDALVLRGRVLTWTWARLPGT